MTNLMERKNSLTRMELATIQELVNYATTASDKKSAKPYLVKLKFLRTDFEPPISFIFDELIGFVEAASGQVRDKERWFGDVVQSLYKLERFVK